VHLPDGQQLEADLVFPEGSTGKGLSPLAAPWTNQAAAHAVIALKLFQKEV
jgi:hypothetical protein